MTLKSLGTGLIIIFSTGILLVAVSYFNLSYSSKSEAKETTESIKEGLGRATLAAG